MRPANCSFLSILLKNFVCLLLSGSCGPSVTITTLIVVVECKEDLNASRTPLVLEHNINKYIRPRTVWQQRSVRSQPCADAVVECMEDLYTSRTLLVLLHNIKKNGRPGTFWQLRFLRSHPYVDGKVECKEDLNASRAPLVLEHNIKKEW